MSGLKSFFNFYNVGMERDGSLRAKWSENSDRSDHVLQRERNHFLPRRDSARRSRLATSALCVTSESDEVRRDQLEARWRCHVVRWGGWAVSEAAAAL